MIALPVHIERVFQQVDGSWNAKISFGELDPEQVRKLAELSRRVCVVGFTLADDFTAEEKTMMQQIAKQFLQLSKKQEKEKDEGYWL